MVNGDVLKRGVVVGLVLVGLVGCVSSGESSDPAEADQAVAQGPKCHIDHVKYEAGELDPTNACRSCQPNIDKDDWTNVANGTSCTDGNGCTRSDTCQQAFEKNPAKYVENAMHGYRLAAPAAMTNTSAPTQVQDPDHAPAKADPASKTPSDSGATDPTPRP